MILRILNVLVARTLVFVALRIKRDDIVIRDFLIQNYSGLANKFLQFFARLIGICAPIQMRFGPFAEAFDFGKAQFGIGCEQRSKRHHRQTSGAANQLVYSFHPQNPLLCRKSRLISKALFIS